MSELLCVQHHYMNLDTFSVADVGDTIDRLHCVKLSFYCGFIVFFLFSFFFFSFLVYCCTRGLISNK